MNHSSKPEASGRLYGGESSEDRAHRRRDQFLDAGLALFGTVGYKGTSVRGLCRQAKLTDRYFYESFSSVEDVLVAVYEREIDRLVAAVFGAIRETAPGTPINVLARPALRAFFEGARNPVVAKTVWFEVLGVSDRVNQLYLDAVSEFGQILLLMIKGLYPTLTLSPVREELLTTGIVGAINQTTMGWIVSGFATPVEELVDANLMILEGLGMRLNLGSTSGNTSA